MEEKTVSEQSFVLTAKANDPAGISQYRLYVNGELYRITNSTGQSVNFTVSALTPSETYTCKVRVYDTLGYWTESEEIEVTTIMKATSVVQVGDFINYDAGKWTEEEITAIGGNNSTDLPTTDGQFGGFIVGQSRNTNSTPVMAENTPYYSGWRVWSVTKDEILLVSAGHPESFYYDGSDANASAELLQDRELSMYANGHSYVTREEMLTIDLASEWYYANIDESAVLEPGIFFPTEEEKPLISMVDIGSYWYLASAMEENYLYSVGTAENRTMGYLNRNALGVRVVLALDADIIVEQGDDHESGFKTWNIVDKYAPEASIEATNVKETSFTLTATGKDTDSGVAKYEFYVDGALVRRVSTTSTKSSFTVTGKTAGETYTCKVRVYDAAGNWKDSDEISVTPSAGVKLASVVEVGDFVDYDAGIWTQADLDKIENSTGSPTVNNSSSLPDEQGEFGGFTTGQSRNTNSTPYDSNYTPDYSGWRVWDIDGDTVTLISAGHPEVYYSSSSSENGTASETILQNRDCTMYVNSYATEAHILTGDEARIWHNTQFGTTYSSMDNWYWQTLSTASPVDVLDNNAYYWLASAYSSFSLCFVNPDDRYMGYYLGGGRASRRACPSYIEC